MVPVLAMALLGVSSFEPDASSRPVVTVTLTMRVESAERLVLETMRDGDAVLVVADALRVGVPDALHERRSVLVGAGDELAVALGDRLTFTTEPTALARLAS